MGAADRFKKASTEFGVDRVKPLPFIFREEKDEQGAVKQIYEADGKYRVKILKCIWVSPRKGPDLFISEFEILQSNNPKAPVGSRFAFKQNMELDAANTRIVEFLFAAVGLDRRNPEHLVEIKKFDEDGKIPDMLAETLEDPKDPTCKNSLKDAFLDVEVTEGVSKEGFQYRKYSFFPVAA